MGFLFGILFTIWVVVIGIIIKQGTIRPATSEASKLLYWALITVVLIMGGAAGWALQSLL